MSLNPQERAEFVNSYTRLLITAWSSEEFAARLAADPRAAIAEVGLSVPDGAEVVVERELPPAAEGSLDGQVSLWEDGQITGRFELHVPQTPQIDTSELTEADLDTIAAGLEVSCCSCPCCCCA
jgi:hypothetical protein